jgi:tRNA nucleotidyltransferase (CCA-adding enzyme)
VKKPDHILSKLQKSGYQAYYVGGCVRDTLLGRPIHDWDITTSAQPEQTMACFERCVPTGIAHGTVTVLYEDGSAEVTTFRSDGIYADGRHPVGVRFVSSLEEDLSRRDFTVNAMAMDQTGKILDPMHGQTDLQAGILRAVGEPQTRFREDALRMLRAIRFSAQLNFAVEEHTMQAIRTCAGLCEKLSAERVRDEMEKTLLSPQPQKVANMASMGLLARFLPMEKRDLSRIADLPAEASVRWTALCRIYPELDLTKLRLDKKTTRNAMTVSRLEIPADRLGWKRLLSEHGREQGELAAALFGCSDVVSEIFASEEPLFLSELAVTGADLKGLSGPQVGESLHRLLSHVLQHPSENQKEILLGML